MTSCNDHPTLKIKNHLRLQCEKRLWLEVHRPELQEVTVDVQWRFDIGNQVNDVARALHENGHLIEWGEGASDALAETARVLAATPEKPVFEATFAHQGVLVQVDVLKKEGHGYRLIEVKSSTSVKAPYYPDCAVQAWVLEGNGLSLCSVELAHIDNQFIYRGDYDYHALLRHKNLASDIAEIKKQVPRWVRRFKKVLAGSEPDIDTGDHCTRPYACPFIAHCAAPSAEYPVSCLPHARGIANELEAEGITDIRDIPAGRLHNDRQEWVRQVTANGKPDFDPAVKKIINAHPYPRYYLDFESAAFAVPVWADTRPYQPLLFQWSCHKETKSGTLTHAEFLDTSGEPPMRRFIESLLDALGESGPIFVYSKFEETRLRELVDRYPELGAGIENLIARLVDLLPLARAHYYHPDMRGSWSLKAVLPTIAPSLNYRDLGEVQEGGAAAVAYCEMIHADTAPARAQALAADLRVYCKRDTEALVALVRFLSSGKIQF